MKTFETLAELTACTGQTIAVTDWFTITQERINHFADATADHQWIHVDPERAKSGAFRRHYRPWFPDLVPDFRFF